MTARPLVSVVCLTYNHEKFIGEALASFLSQQTDFDVEIIVHDDASTDGTERVVRDFCARHPGRIRYVRQPTNLYSRGARMFDVACSHARGEFIALCEGDDFWVDPAKLRRQAAMLRDDPSLGVVFGDVDVLVERTGRLLASHDASRGYVPPVGDVRASLLQYNPYKTCTAMVRGAAMEGYVAHARRLRARMEDYVLWLHVASRYSVAYIPSVLATYRVLESSASHFAALEGRIRFARSVYRVGTYFNRRMGGVVDNALLRANYCFSLFMYCLHARRFAEALRFIHPSRAFLELVLASARRGLSLARRRR